jgi:hypothetical protein
MEKSREQESDYTEEWYDLNCNPQRDYHGKAKKDRGRMRDYKHERDGADYLSLPDARDDE